MCHEDFLLNVNKKCVKKLIGWNVEVKKLNFGKEAE